MGWLAVVAAASLALGGAGCTTHGPGHGGHSRMACCRCACQMMQPDPSNPGQCKMCGHAAADHAPSGKAKDASHH